MFNCLYTIIVNRDVRGLLNYPTGIGVLMTINPSEEQTNGGFFKAQLPENWNPTLIDYKSVVVNSASYVNHNANNNQQNAAQA